jgi:hypothetical protein
MAQIAPVGTFSVRAYDGVWFYMARAGTLGVGKAQGKACTR